MTLADFTSLNLIVPSLRGQDAASVIQELSQALQQERRIPELLPFYQAALNREFMMGTDTEAGMAFPHARLPVLKDVSFAFGRTDKPLTWGIKSAGTVELVFLLAVPATDSTQYLLLISGLARFAKQRGLVEKLRSASDAARIFEVFGQIELRTGAPAVEGRKVLA